MLITHPYIFNQFSQYFHHEYWRATLRLELSHEIKPCHRQIAYFDVGQISAIEGFAQALVRYWDIHVSSAEQ